MGALERLAERLNPRDELRLSELGISPATFVARGVRVAVLPDAALLRARLADGTIVRGRNRAGYGGRGVFMFRDQVEPELAVMRNVLRPGDVMIDVGCCVGTYSMVAGAEVGRSGAVLAVDPNPDAIALLTGTAAENGFTHLAAICAAASDSVGLTQFTVEDERPDNRHMDPDAEIQSSAMHRVVPTTTLDELTGELGLRDRVRFVKIDAEGGEPRVLAGAEKTILASRPVLILETAISDVPSLDDHRVFQRPGSRNHLLVHEADDDALDVVRAADGFDEVVG